MSNGCLGTVADAYAHARGAALSGLFGAVVSPFWPMHDALHHARARPTPMGGRVTHPPSGRALGQRFKSIDCIRIIAVGLQVPMAQIYDVRKQVCARVVVVLKEHQRSGH
ncbi:hypothetical protein CLV88_11282 [Shimia abyssi]|uniref:Uncharacterized protein n=1 Tax=Shimia abyssi TaxID=1662395 RepID=A0A2P8F8Y1_9RHOB|nr:hypothetical protein CLV88_11282 [Shimia abyssi]